MKYIRLLKHFFPPLIKFVLSGLVCPFIRGRKRYRQLWLISERGDDARDNGYRFFEYLCACHKDVNCVYVIDPASADAPKVQALGKVVTHNSWEHYFMLHNATLLISSHIMGFTPCPELFILIEKYTKYRLKGKRVFLQHGITKAKTVGLMADVVKLDMFVCGAKPEYEYVRDNFGHPAGVVRYTGLARYDTLHSCEAPKKQILIMPTWRKWLNQLTAEEFRKSAYFENYNALLNNEELRTLLKAHGWRIVFYPHYEMQKFTSCFTGNDVVTIADFAHYDVQKLLMESGMLITDYSSVLFDFAYMGKPVLFYQFDYADFSQKHYETGYFHHEDELLGKTFDNIPDLVNKVRNLLEGRDDNERYRENAKMFFQYRDSNNCRRIYEGIEELIV